jgi:hypothetical protein
MARTLEQIGLRPGEGIGGVAGRILFGGELQFPDQEILDVVLSARGARLTDKDRKELRDQIIDCETETSVLFGMLASIAGKSYPFLTREKIADELIRVVTA